MGWLTDILFNASNNPALATAHTVLVLGLVAAIGLSIGSIRFFGIRLGVAGVLFVGLVFGHYGFGFDHSVLEFARDFGLILFVYTVGLQIGPGFAASLKQQGLPLNILAASIVLLSVAMTVVIGRCFVPHADFPAMVGVFSGATTNTPSLAASQQALAGIAAPASEAAKLPALGYAVAYPFGVAGIILSMYLLRVMFRVDIPKERGLMAAKSGSAKKLQAQSLHVTNESILGETLGHIMAQTRKDIVVSRIVSGENTRVATDDSVIEQGDMLVAVGHSSEIDEFKRLIGEDSTVDLTKASTEISSRDLLVSKKDVIGQSVPDLMLPENYNVTATRVLRGDVEMPATSGVKIVFGDRIRVVGSDENVAKVATLFGDSARERDTPIIIPMFLGIVAGVVLGMLPIPLPGFPVPVKLGLAGGPLVAAIILSRIGKVGPLVWYMPRGANLTVREIGIILFLSCVGLKAGDKFVDTLVHGQGFIWMGYGALITVVPLLVIGITARLALKLNYMSLTGLLAGSMTDPPALAFAGSITNSEAPSVAYAAVYPLVMLMRIIAAQAMILFFR